MKTEESKMKEMYRETFARVHTPEGVRSRILNTDVDAAAAGSHVGSRAECSDTGSCTERSMSRRAGGRRAGGRRRFSMVMAACLLVVLVSGTALAVSSGDGLKNWFEASWNAGNNQELGEEQTAMIDSLTTPLGVSQTVGDVTVTADSIAYSDGYFWIMLYAEGVKMDPDQAYGFAKNQMEIQSETIEDLSWGWGSITDASRNENRARIFIDGQLNPDLLQQVSGEEAVFTLKMTDFMEHPTDADKKKLLQEGDWTLEFTVPLTETGKTLTPDDFDSEFTVPNSMDSAVVHISDMEINSVGIRYIVSSDLEAENVHGEMPIAVMKNGGQVSITGGSGEEQEDGSWLMRYQWSMPLDVDQIAAIRLGSAAVDCTVGE
ncbi:MAG: hypothetical protein ACI4LQ_00555 [Anaerovoracaceae bacterium]